MRIGDYKADEPYQVAEAVTPSDATNFTNGATDAIFVGSVGAVAAVIGGSAFTFGAVPAGTLLPIRCTRINSTNTTASNIVALYYGR